MKVVYLDLETENNEYFRVLSSPRNPNNFIVASGWAIGAGERQGAYSKTGVTDPAPYLRDPEVTHLVAHNISFDLQWLLNRCHDDVLEYLRRGGKIFDTMVAEYYLSGQMDTYPALSDTAPKYGGTKKIDAVKLEWQTGKKTSEIDKFLLFDEYLLGESGDIENLRKVFRGQYKIAKQRGMWTMLENRMEALLYAILCEHNGLHIDPGIAKHALESLQEHVEALEDSVTKGIVERCDNSVARGNNIPSEVEINLGSTQHRSAIIFGGDIKYITRVPRTDDEGNILYEKATVYMDKEGNHYLIPDSRCITFASGKNKGAYKPFKVDTKVIKTKKAEAIYQCKGILDLASMPREFVGELDSKYKSEATGYYSTGSEVMDMLVDRQDIPVESRELLVDLQRLQKMQKELTTYFISGDSGKEKGMLTYLTEHNIIYHSINTCATRTGRWSSTRPNMQNLPRGDSDNYKSVVKYMFTSRYNDPEWLDWSLANRFITSEVYQYCTQALLRGEKPGCVLQADYNALEIRALAVFTKDRNLVKALEEGTDMHCLRLANQIGEDYESVLKKCKDKEHPEHEKYHAMRTAIKPKAYCMQYGGSAYAIAMTTGCSVKEAEEFITAEKALFPEVEEWFDGVYDYVEQHYSKEEALFDDGRHYFYNVGEWHSPHGTTYKFTQKPVKKWVEGKEVTMLEYRIPDIRNYPIQGESAYFVQVACGKLARELLSKEFYGGAVVPTSQTHDSVYLDVCKKHLTEVSESVKVTLEAVKEYMEGYEINVDFPVDVEVGYDLKGGSSVADFLLP